MPQAGWPPGAVAGDPHSALHQFPRHPASGDVKSHPIAMEQRWPATWFDSRRSNSGRAHVLSATVQRSCATGGMPRESRIASIAT